MEAGNQGGEGEQSMAPNWSPKIKVASEKMPVVRYPTDLFFKQQKSSIFNLVLWCFNINTYLALKTRRQIQPNIGDI